MVKQGSAKKIADSTHPDVIQRQASDPLASVGVGASAGCGKTKVLNDRVLRLLLPNGKKPGTPAHKILCITYTKAAAGEMRNRLSKFLAAWAVLPLNGDNGLIHHEKFGMSKLLGRAPTEEEIKAARKLFAEVIDAPGGLQIMTIHAFCQSVLGRFPLEAGVTPQFKVIEDSGSVFAAAIRRSLSKCRNQHNSPLQQAATRLSAETDPGSLESLLRAAVTERDQIKTLMGWEPEGLYTKICEQLQTPPGRTPEEIISEACRNESFAADEIKNFAAIMAQAKGKKEPEFAQQILTWLALNPEERSKNFSSYKAIYLTDNGIRTQGFPSKETDRNYPGCKDTLVVEAQRLLTVQDTANRAACARLTADLFMVATDVLQEYENIKSAQGVLDFDDLILRTLWLLSGSTASGKPMAPWVLYKLDQGIDHILLDEAQDTNPEQWDIVKALAETFFEGLGAREGVQRTLFNVGDRKQSIYGFNRADPEKFAATQTYFSAKAKAAGQEWRDVPMDISFRSAPAILQAVDAVFAGNVLALPVAHSTMRGGQQGIVELWPLAPYVTPRRENRDDFWSPPVTIEETQDGQAALARQIAVTIDSWIGHEILPARGRPVCAGDILILVRTRTAFFNRLVRELKQRKIPVSGVDRMVLNEEIAVQDLLAAAGFALLPEDDLTLACLLKSPLLGWSEEHLMNLAAYRPENTSLWQALQDNGRDVPYLENLITTIGKRPYEFFSDLLHKSCPGDIHSGLRAMLGRLGADARDPLEELLAACLDYEQENIPSLQGFLDWQQRGESAIKRELEESGDKVRIMTVHGAKGLQAPVVILPDTIPRKTGARGTERLLWPDKTGLPVPLYSPRAESDCTPYVHAMDAVQSAQDREYRRLLYVAMTRAEDRLYVCGTHSKDEAPEGSWYALVQNGLRDLGAENIGNGVLQFRNDQIRPADRAEPSKNIEKDSGKSLPQWLFDKAAAEHTPDILRPSKALAPDEFDVPVSSPLASDAQIRFRRGLITHKLLQLLPSLPTPDRPIAAVNFLQQYANDLKPEIRQGILDETTSILENPDFAGFFAPGSWAESSIGGTLADGRSVNGQIDRLRITDNEIWIIDYKTNRPPPAVQKDIPRLYIEQMRAYRDVLAAAYPGRTIHSALLWTDGPRLMILDLSDV